MTEKKDPINRMLEMQKLLQKVTEANKQKEELETQKKIESIPIVETQHSEQTDECSNLPTKFLSLNQMKLSVKDISTSTNFIDKLKNDDSKYNEKQIEEKKAIKIVRSMARLTAGTVSVAPLKCKGVNCAFSQSCVTGDTVVSGPRDKKIRDIEIGDTVYSFNTETKQIEKDKVTDKIITEKKIIYLITTKYKNKLKVTSDHRILTINKKLDTFTWKTIDKGLTKGSRILIADVDEFIDDDLESVGDVFVDYITSIKELYTEDVYDITIKKNHNFIANTIIVHNCELFKQNEHIVGEDCLIESNLLQYWAEKYKDEFNIDEKSITDLHAIGRLCTYDLYEMRLTRYLSENDQTLLVDFVSSYDENNNPISNKATSAAWETIDKIDRMRSKTLKELMATREAKSKLVQTVTQAHASNSLSALKEKLDQLIKNQSSIVVDSEARVVN